MMRGFAIIPAAGLSTRMGSTTSGQARKQLAEIAGAPILVHTLRTFDRCPGLERILVPVRPEDKDLVAARVANEKLRIEVEVLEGGAARQDSVWNALQRLSSVQADAWVMIHDAVRPFVELETLMRALSAAEKHAAVITGVPAVDTIKQVERVGADSNRVTTTLQRERIVLAQTPQVFHLDLLRRAFEKARQDGFYGTDEAALVEHLGEDVFVVPGSARNWKITTPADLPLAELLLGAAAASSS
ncbi:MAG TPA: 2-C-methyl-D-erythritol 4-phosphate cytidylyltransferase [Terriglobales bacterium]|nr:2-C-methyl-D-erythritol 4-phosphate cytidylyltransferase [Terriglobales bacterium]